MRFYVWHQRTHGLTCRPDQPRVPFKRWIDFHKPVINRCSAFVKYHLDNAKSLVYGLKQGAVALLVRAKRVLDLTTSRYIHSRGDKVGNPAASVPQRSELKVDPQQLFPDHACLNIRTDEIAIGDLVAPVAHLCLHLGRITPPVTVPELLAQHVTGSNTGCLQWRTVGLNQCAVWRQHANKGKEIVQNTTRELLAFNQCLGSPFLLRDVKSSADEQAASAQVAAQGC